MFSKKQAVAYCCEPIDTIQGFKEATESLEKYHIHHRFEDMGLSRKDLMELGLLYNRPACELVFMNGREHNRTHSTRDLSDKYKQTLWGKGHVPEFTAEHRQHISEAKTGVKQSPNIPCTLKKPVQLYGLQKSSIVSYIMHKNGYGLLKSVRNTQKLLSVCGGLIRNTVKL